MTDGERDKVLKTAALMKLRIADERDFIAAEEALRLAESMGETLTRLSDGAPEIGFPPESCPLRADEPLTSLPPETVLSLAPQSRDGCITVPRTVKDGTENE